MSELGIASATLIRTGDKTEILHNEVYGCLVRTKASHFNEGGVTAGYAVIDSPYVLPEGQPLQPIIKL